MLLVLIITSIMAMWSFALPVVDGSVEEDPFPKYI